MNEPDAPPVHDLRRDPVVTLDGPAGSGKSSTAVAVARELGLRHLDSGALYRALTYALLAGGVSPARWAELSEEDLHALRIRLVGTPHGFDVIVDDRAVAAELRTPEVTRHVPVLARQPAARRALIDLQRSAAVDGGLVADGRDMGTVVFPDADVKVFLVADVEERARRRLLQMGVERPDPSVLRAQTEEIAERDRIDSEREHSPLVEPPGAYRIDTTELDFREQVRAVVELVRRLTTP